MKYIIIGIFLFSSFTINAQKDKTIYFGVNVGVKFANKNYATRYNGLYQNGLYNTLNSTINYNNIYTSLGDKHFELMAVPGKIRYTPGLITGIQLGYILTPNVQVSIEGNFNKLTVKDVYTIEIFDPTNWTSEPTIGLGQLYAKESRFNGRFNIDYIGDGDKVKFIFGASGIFMAWRIDEHVAIYNGFNMPLFSVHNPTNNLGNTTGGMSWGGGLNMGLEYRFQENMVCQIMYQPYIVFPDYDVYIEKRFLLQHDLTARFLWK